MLLTQCFPTMLPQSASHIVLPPEYSSHSAPHIVLPTQGSSHRAPPTRLLTQDSSHRTPHTVLLTQGSPHRTPYTGRDAPHTVLPTQCSSYRTPHTGLPTPVLPTPVLLTQGSPLLLLEKLWFFKGIHIFGSILRWLRVTEYKWRTQSLKGLEWAQMKPVDLRGGVGGS